MGYLLLIVFIFAGELLLKNRIEKTEEEGNTKQLFNGKILIRKYHNKGFALNAGSSRPALVAAVSLGLALLCTLLFAVSLGTRGNRLLRTGLALLLGGAYSNTYDRLYRKYVVDYFSFGVKSPKLRRVIFNLSDFCIMLGALLCVLSQA